MFTHIVVALDLQIGGDRALPVVRALSQLADVTVELLTISSPNMTDEVDQFELSRRATANGWPAHSYAVVHANDTAQAINDHLGDRHDVLLVMATSAKRPFFGHLLGSVSEAVLRLIERPILLVGPNVAVNASWQRPTPILCVDPASSEAEAVSAVETWTKTFPGESPWITEVIATAATGDAGDDALESARVRRLAGLLADKGVGPRWKVVHGGAPEMWLEDFADDVPEPVFITTSTNWTSGRHWHSTTRQLVQRSTHPVLVVPTRPHATIGLPESTIPNARCVS